jgi:hypothetical protein
MGEIFTAYQTLNKVLNLGLTKDQFLAAEAQFKLDFAERMKFPTGVTRDPMQLSAEWELTATLTPRRRAIATTTRQSLSQLTATAQTQMQQKLGKAAVPSRTTLKTTATRRSPKKG